MDIRKTTESIRMSHPLEKEDLLETFATFLNSTGNKENDEIRFGPRSKHICQLAERSLMIEEQNQ